MPVHDWMRVDAGLIHHFHQAWTAAVCDALNTTVLPRGYFALLEESINDPIRDTVTVRQAELYAGKANRVTVRHEHGQIVAVLEIVSPGNKNSRTALRAFVDKIRDLLDQGVHVLVVDLFPPGPRDPQGIHKTIWDEIAEVQFELPPDKPLTLAAYEAGPVKVAYVEPVAVGDALPDCRCSWPQRSTSRRRWKPPIRRRGASFRRR